MNEFELYAALKEAGENKDCKAIEELILLGADVNDNNGWLLSHTIIENDFEFLTYLIKKGGDMNKYKSTFLYLASNIKEKNCEPIMRLVLSFKPDVNEKIRGGTPLLSAVAYNNLSNIKLLVEHHANIHENFSFAFIDAMQWNHMQTFEYLIQNVSDWTQLEKDMKHYENYHRQSKEASEKILKLVLKYKLEDTLTINNKKVVKNKI